jgi:hypothetical protein
MRRDARLPIRSCANGRMKTFLPLLLTTCLAAQESRSAVELVAKRLADANATKADAAMVDLIRGGTSNVPVLRQVLAATKDPACRARAERALALCSIDAPAENGVKVGLRSDRTTVAPGDAVTLTATIGNVTDRPIAIYLGMSFSGNALENGLALQQCDRDGAAGDQGRFGRVGFCGTGAHAIVEVVPPWSTKQFTTLAIYHERAIKTAIPHDGPHLGVGHGVFVPVTPEPDGNRVRLRVHFAVDPDELVRALDPATKPEWKGTLVSNPVVLQLRATR